MKITILITLIALLTLSIAAHADEKITTAKVKELATSNSENASYLSKDGKVRYSVEHVITEDGKVEMRAKKQYLPAITDGINRDKTSKFRIPPSAKKTAKYFAKGANHAMFLSMIIDVLGDGVDYILDPKNNSVQYVENGDYSIQNSFGTFNANTAQAVCQLYINKRNSLTPNFAFIVEVSSDEKYCLVYGGNSNYQGAIAANIISKRKKETKVMNDEEFAQAVIELAKADNAKAKKVVLDVAKQAVSDGDYDKEIQKAVDELNADETKDDTQDNQDNTSDSSNASSSDSTNTDSQDDTQATPNTSNPQTDNNGGNDKDKSEFPPFCEYAKTVCDFIDWVKKDSNDKDTELDIPEPKTPTIDTNIRFNGQCPADMIISGNIFGQQISFTLFEWTKFCEILAMIKPIIIAMASYGAFKIVGGVNVAD